MSDRLRYGRQSRLAEIGEARQARLLAAKVTLGASGFARAIEERYVRGFGAAIVAPRSSTEGDGATPVPVDLCLEHPAAREVGEGALRALVAFRAIVEGS